MSAWETVQSAYVEAATVALPLHRLLLFAAAFLGATGVRSQTHLSIVETVSELKLASFTSLQAGPLALATFGDIFSAFSVVALGWMLSRIFLAVVFWLAARGTNLWERSENALKGAVVPQTAEDRKSAIELIENSLKDVRGQLRIRNSVSELLLGGGAALLLATFWGNFADFALGTLFLLLGGVSSVMAVRLFLSEYFGPAMVKAKFQGRPAPTPLNAS